MSALRTYGGETAARRLVNETPPVHRRSDNFFRPGDVVRREMFDGDSDRPGHLFPVGLVVWVGHDVGVLWSGDPDA